MAVAENGFKVSDIGYFVYANGIKGKEAFDGKLEFDVKIIPYKGNDNWVEGTLVKAHECLLDKQTPKAGKNCDFCDYCEAINRVK